MAKHALMKRGSEMMNVPPEKVQEYLKDGWTIVEKATESVAAETAPPDEEPEAESAESPVKKRASKKA